MLMLNYKINKYNRRIKMKPDLVPESLISLIRKKVLEVTPEDEVTPKEKKKNQIFMKISAKIH